MLVIWVVIYFLNLENNENNEKDYFISGMHRGMEHAGPAVLYSKINFLIDRRIDR